MILAMRTIPDHHKQKHWLGRIGIGYGIGYFEGFSGDNHRHQHQSKRLYWLNAEKRHSVSALLLAAPSLIVLTIIGAPSLLIGCWMSLIAVHLAFQHANLDYRPGPFKKYICCCGSTSLTS